MKAKKSAEDPGFFEYFGAKIDCIIAWFSAKFHNLRTFYNRHNAKYRAALKNHKPLRILPSSLIVLALFLALTPFYFSQIAANDVVLHDGSADAATPKILQSGEISQKIHDDNASRELTSISIMVGTYARINDADYEFVLKKGDEVIHSQIFHATRLNDNQYHSFHFSPVRIDPAAEYSFVIRPLKTSDNNAIAFYYAANKNANAADKNATNIVDQNTNTSATEIIYQTKYRSEFYVPVIIASVIFALIFFAVNFLINSGKIKTEFYFLAAMSAFIIPLIFIYPINTIPDEFYHFGGAVRLAQYDWSESLAHNISPNHIIALPETSDSCIGVYHIPPTSEQISSCFASSGAAVMDRFHGLPKTQAFIAYVPAALGIMFGDLISDSPAVIYLFGRATNFIVAAAIIIFALSLIKKHRLILLAIIMIPMFLQQSASYSYDGILNALCLLIVAYALRFLTTDLKIRRRDFVIISIALIIIGVVKLPYLTVATPLLFIKNAKFGQQKFHKWLFLCGVGFAVLVAYVLNSRLIVAGAEFSSVDVNPRGLPFISIFTHPRAFIKMLATTIFAQSWLYLTGLIGFFGWFFFSLNPILVAGYLIFFIIVARSEQGNFRPAMRVLSILASFAVIGAVFLAMYLSYTTAGAPIIEGIQGRYFIPIVPLLMLAFIPQKPKLKLPVSTAYAFLNFVTFCFIITLLVGFY